jgi:hypothetical protein
MRKPLVVIPAWPESFLQLTSALLVLKKDSGQAGMTEVVQGSLPLNVAMLMNSFVIQNIQ